MVKWRAATIERRAETDRVWRASNPEKTRNISRKWRANNVEKARANTRNSNRAKREAHPELVRERDRKWKIANPDRIRAYCHSVRAKRNSALGSFTAPEFDAIVRKQRGRCIDCGLKRKLTVGHMIPLSKGGSNYIHNIRAQCMPCNAKQHVSIHRLADFTLFDVRISNHN